ncbi:MAG: zinc ABC transporter substrate-binding protein, partial [Desulfurococcales archaeon]|nr:zinc ABC transporter substrate-binding protein [Desulfurococcales archaeon]
MGSNGLIIVSALALAALLALQPTIAQAGEPHRLRVAVTAPVLAPLVESLGGGGVEVDSIIPPGADPHTYEPPARLAGALDGYDVIVMSGPHHLRVEEVILEWRRQGLLRHPIIVYYGNYTGCGLRPLEYGGSQNPHGYWWGPRSLAAVARCVGEALAEADPARAGYYTSRASLYAAMAESLAGRLEGIRVAAYSP